MYKVSIHSAQGDEPVAVLYQGDDYGAAFEAACAARSVPANRGKWIKLATPQRDKWAAVY